MQNLILQNLFLQKLMEVNITLIVLLLKNVLKFMINQKEITMLIKKLESKHQC